MTEGATVWVRARVKKATPEKVVVWVLGKFDQELVVMAPGDVREDAAPRPPGA